MKTKVQNRSFSNRRSTNQDTNKSAYRKKLNPAANLNGEGIYTKAARKKF